MLFHSASLMGHKSWPVGDSPAMPSSVSRAAMLALSSVENPFAISYIFFCRSLSL